MKSLIDQINSSHEHNKEPQYYIVRTHSAGVFAGYIESRNGHETVMTKARRLWRWEGAASLSQLAMEGTTNPAECKFPIAMDRVTILQTIEIIEATDRARISIEDVPIWSAKTNDYCAGSGSGTGSGIGYENGMGIGSGSINISGSGNSDGSGEG